MKVDLSDLLKKKIAKKEFHLELDVKEFFDGRENVTILRPIKINGVLHSSGELIDMFCAVDAELQFVCSRCLEPFSYNVNFDFSEKLSKEDLLNKDEDIIFINSDTLDITEIVVNNIILNLPLKRLCREDCKGLCQHCGQNLNISTCKCDKDDIDPRLAKLKDIFFTD